MVLLELVGHSLVVGFAVPALLLPLALLFLDDEEIVLQSGPARLFNLAERFPGQSSLDVLGALVLLDERCLWERVVLIERILNVEVLGLFVGEGALSGLALFLADLLLLGLLPGRIPAHC